MEIVDLRRILDKEERQKTLDRFFRRYLSCGGNDMKAHKWVGHKHIEGLRAWYDRCERCGRHRIHQTTGNIVLLDSSLNIEALLIVNSGYESLWRAVLPR
jgi:hypothetical protein